MKIPAQNVTVSEFTLRATFHHTSWQFGNCKTLTKQNHHGTLDYDALRQVGVHRQFLFPVSACPTTPIYKTLRRWGCPAYTHHFGRTTDIRALSRLSKLSIPFNLNTARRRNSATRRERNNSEHSIWFDCFDSPSFLDRFSSENLHAPKSRSIDAHFDSSLPRLCARPRRRMFVRAFRVCLQRMSVCVRMTSFFFFFVSVYKYASVVGGPRESRWQAANCLLPLQLAGTGRDPSSHYALFYEFYF